MERAARIVILFAITTFATIGVTPAQVLTDPHELLPTEDDFPDGFRPQPDRDIDIVGATWSDSYRVFRQTDPSTGEETGTKLDVRVSVYTTDAGAEDWLHFYLWSLERESFSSDPLSDLGHEAFVLRTHGLSATEAAGVLFRVDNVVGWTQVSDGANPPDLDQALAVAHLLVTRLTDPALASSN